jgi:hypothetical protein
MSTAVSTSKSKSGTASEAAQPGTVSWPLVLVSMLGGLMLAATVGLWAYFGSTVFFEMVRTGWTACF